MDLQPIENTSLVAASDLFVQVFNAAPWNEDWKPETALRRLQQIFHTPDFVGFGAWQEGQLVGMVLGCVEQRSSSLGFQVQEMLVHPDLQGQGVGKALMAHLTLHLTDLQVGSMYLITMQDSPAQRFYAKNGFRPAFRNFVMVSSQAPSREAMGEKA